MIKKLGILVIFLLLLSALAVYFLTTREIGLPGTQYTILVRPADNARSVHRKLTEAGLTVPRSIYSFLMVYTGTDKKIKPGRYRFGGDLNTYQLVKCFQAGAVELSKVTIPEGKTLRKIVRLLAASVPTDSLKLTELLSDAEFLRKVEIDAPSFEGYLFPETYLFNAEEMPETVVATMVNMFKSVFSETLRLRADTLRMSTNQVVTLAAMIEAESADGNERSLISSVFHNRLNKGWKLQCDPTVIYALGGLDRPLLKKELEFDSPYNTYLYGGLPPGPICSPGLASMKAALYPENSDYFYFVADGEGKHIFTRTLREHQQAISEVKRRIAQRR